VSADALRANARTMRRIAGHSRVAFVLKSNAYGHGLVQTACTIEPFADALCVYALEEAVALRDAGIGCPVLILGPVQRSELHDAHATRAAIALWDSSGTYAREVASVGRDGGAPFRVHVKIDTGVSRLGLDPAQAANTIANYARHTELSIDGIFSHLAAAEEVDSPFTHVQLNRLNDVFHHSLPALRAAGVPARHIAASAATMLWPQTRLDLVRIGIALYGLWPSAATRAAVGGGQEIDARLPNRAQRRGRRRSIRRRRGAHVCVAVSAARQRLHIRRLARRRRAGRGPGRGRRPNILGRGQRSARRPSAAGTAGSVSDRGTSRYHEGRWDEGRGNGVWGPKHGKA